MHEAPRYLQHGDEAQGRAGVVPNAQSSDVPPEIFDQALRWIIPANNHKAVCALFLNLVTFRAIRHWRVGRRRAPHWAREILKEKLRQQVAELQSLIERL